MSDGSYRYETLQLHAGYEPEPTTRSSAVPIYQTSSFSFRDADHGAALFAMSESGYINTRLSNPTNEALENRVAALEGGVGGLALASGQAAWLVTITSLAQTGDNIVCTANLYPGINYMLNTMPHRFGIDVRFASREDPAEIADLIDDRTKSIHLETLSHPHFNIPDYEAIAKVAHDHGVALVVDNTAAAAGYLCRPIEHGADIIIASGKWFGGHGVSIGGILVDGGKFDWMNGRYPLFSKPREGRVQAFQGVRFGEEYVEKSSGLNPAFIRQAKAEGMRFQGAALSPFNAFLFLLGIDSLSLRVERQCQNALAFAKWLDAHPKVKWVTYPGLDSHPDRKLAAKYLRSGMYGTMVSFGLEGGWDAGRALVEKTKLVTHMANMGESKTLLMHPASSSHAHLSPEQLDNSGYTTDNVRVSMGAEHIDDILSDFDQAIAAATS
ncbi:MAG: O-acetylhomoserine aminocarboxypropyltransferase/cysteine synthase family protein [Alphaproteobacteria bacterium]